MDKRSKTIISNVYVPQKLIVQTTPINLPVEQTSENLYNSSSVKLQSLRDANISYTGRITGKLYQWNGAGDVQAVDALDAPYLLEKRIKTQSCCSSGDVVIFQIVD